LGRYRAFSGDFGKDRMATKSKLEQAVEARASSLNEAQRELVMSQLAVYKKNIARLTFIESEIDTINSIPTASREEVRSKQAYRASLSYEHNQLTTANSKIAADLFEFMKE